LFLEVAAGCSAAPWSWLLLRGAGPEDGFEGGCGVPHRLRPDTA